MTDKEKLDKLVAEIKRRYRKCNGATPATEYQELLDFIDSMQEEPKFKLGDIVRRKSDGLEARVINIVDGTYIVECEDWNDSILEHQWELVEEPKECMYSKDNYTDEDRKVLCEGCNEKCRFNKKEKSTSEDLGQAIDTYLSTYFGGEKEKQDWPFLKKMAIYFANWQKSKDAKLIINAKDDGYRLGLATMKQQMMAKAVDGIVHHFEKCGVASVHYTDPTGVPMAYFTSPEGLSAGDKVKVIVIKEG